MQGRNKVGSLKCTACAGAKQCISSLAIISGLAGYAVDPQVGITVPSPDGGVPERGSAFTLYEEKSFPAARGTARWSEVAAERH